MAACSGALGVLGAASSALRQLELKNKPRRRVVRKGYLFMGVLREVGRFNRGGEDVEVETEVKTGKEMKMELGGR